MLTINLTQSNFQPHQTIAGSVQWSDLPPGTDRIEIRLIWYTLGKGTQDVVTVETVRVAAPPPIGNSPFEFIAPGRPLSFSGTLISLIWAIEVIAFPQQNAERFQLVINDSKQPIVLTPLPEKPTKQSSSYPMFENLINGIHYRRT